MTHKRFVILFVVTVLPLLLSVPLWLSPNVDVSHIEAIIVAGSFYLSVLALVGMSMYLFQRTRLHRLSKLGSVTFQFMFAGALVFLPEFLAQLAQRYGASQGLRLFSGDGVLEPIMVAYFVAGVGLVSVVGLAIYVYFPSPQPHA
jgi:hypothetical protein